MKKTFVLCLLVLAGCDGLVPDAITEPQKEEPVAPGVEDATPEIAATAAPEKTVTPDLATEAEDVLRKALDDWVFGEATYAPVEDADIDFAPLGYIVGNPLSSYEIIAVKVVDTDEAKVAVRVVFPTRGGVAEIKKNVSYTVLKNSPTGIEITGSRWMIGPAGVNGAASGEN